MTWIRNASEPIERRSIDITKLVACGVAVTLLGVASQSQSSIDANLFATLNDLSGSLVGLAEGFFALGSIWAVVAVVALFVLLREFGLALRVAIAGTAAWGIAEVVNDLLGVQSIAGVHINVRVGSGPVFPSANVAVITALAVAISPFAVRALRRVFWIAVILVALAAMYLGAGLPSDVLGGIFLGLTCAAAVLVAFGSPAGKPSIEEARAALVDLGYDVEDVRRATTSIPRAAVMDVVLTSGERYRVDIFGRDQRDGQIASKLWHRLMYKEPAFRVFGSRIQEVEHIGYTMLLADRAGVHTPQVVETGIGGADAAVLVTTAAIGAPLGELAAEQITDDVLAAAWAQVDQLHAAGISHGELDPSRILVADGQVALDDFSAADATRDKLWIDRDVAALLVATALRVGNDRAIAAAVKALGKERIGEVLPVVQPAALPAETMRGTKHQGKVLKELRDEAATATGVEKVKPLTIRRLTWANVGIMAGVILALVLAIQGLEGVNWASVEGQFENADWGWALLCAVLYPLVPIAWATALMGCVNTDLPFIPTALTQLACSFLNLITPNGIGGTALQIDYLYKEGVPPASGGSAMVLSTGVGGAIQMLLFITAVAITGAAIDTTSSSSSDSTSFLAIALVAAAVGVVMFVPRIRGKVVPAVKKAASDIWAVARTPKKLLQLFGGDLGGNLLYPALLGLCLLAFHQSLDYGELVVAQVGAGMLGNVAPVPGGIGVYGSALLGALIAFGIPTAPATATVILFRAITFMIPPIFGFFTLRYLRAKGYA